MCGIYGVVGPISRSRTWLRNARQTLTHRGPDGFGSYQDHQVALGMTRLAIIDVKGGDQPLYNEDKSLVIVGNGEIYNYVELRSLLKKSKHKLSSGSDIETTLHLYEEYGLHFVEHLRGMFALALYDKKKHKLILARDRLGEKPLYWAKTNNRLIFASEIKAILKYPGLSKKLNPDSIDHYFHFYYVPEPKTLFSHIYKLPPAHIMEINTLTGEFTQKKYWDESRVSPVFSGDPTRRIRDKFIESCELTLRSDVPVGISLSGGIDSSAILAVCAPRYRHRMTAFSVGYDGESDSDETEMAKQLAINFGVKFVSQKINTSDMVKDFPQLVYNSDDPIADIAGYSIYRVSKLARDHNVPVLLGGLGGDELFWGYSSINNYVCLTLNKHRFLNSPSGRTLHSLFTPFQAPRIFNPRNPLLSSLLSPATQLVFYDQGAEFKNCESFLKRLYLPSFSSEITPANSYSILNYDTKLSETEIMSNCLSLLRKTWLVSNCLDLNDRLSMASSVDLRSPFLDFKLLELTLSSSAVVSGYTLPPKYYFKQAVKDILPPQLLSLPKRGFTPPVGLWLRALTKNYLHLLPDGFLVSEGILDGDRIKSVINKPDSRHLTQIYQLIFLEVWGREYIWNTSPSDLHIK
ncbi:asparagine synthase (glutamine-hydrolyzing) [Candidatus Amesbacteria bacterium RIFCSPHIGHO2_02_FULL_47_9]|nr:MAG: asparagine synthase (glutamine-hydrolyzing) [Candidatus Amesbacteria bacterium RIFCSPHIGHO2_02_FULL_47_9]